MEFLRAILENIISNLIWVLVVFLVLWLRDRKKKEQIALCLEAYLTFLCKSTGTLNNALYPYIYLIEAKVTQGTILPTLLDHIYHLASTVAVQTQNILGMIESRSLQEKVLQLYYQTTIFQTHISQSQVATNIIVGNPEELVAPPRQQEEMNLYRTFDEDFHRQVREIYALYPEAIQKRVPAEVMAILDQQSALQTRVNEKKSAK